MTRKLSILLLPILLSCASDNGYLYHPLDPGGHSPRIPVTFELELSDTVRPVDLYLCGRFSHRYKADGLPLRIEFKSPEGRRYGEEIRLPLINQQQIRTSCGYDQEWSYRTGIVPRTGEAGKWEVSLFLRDGEEGDGPVKNIYGLGISTQYERKR